MRVVWARHPLTASDIIARLQNVDPTWHPKTTRALLSRLVEKKVLEYEPRGRVYVYSPLVTETQCIAAASESFLDRVFGGSLRPMLAHFVQHRKLSRKQIEELKRILDGKEDELR